MENLNYYYVGDKNSVPASYNSTMHLDSSPKNPKTNWWKRILTFIYRCGFVYLFYYIYDHIKKTEGDVLIAYISLIASGLFLIDAVTGLFKKNDGSDQIYS